MYCIVAPGADLQAHQNLWARDSQNDKKRQTGRDSETVVRVSVERGLVGLERAESELGDTERQRQRQGQPRPRKRLTVTVRERDKGKGEQAKSAGTGSSMGCGAGGWAWVPGCEGHWCGG